MNVYLIDSNERLWLVIPSFNTDIFTILVTQRKKFTKRMIKNQDMRAIFLVPMANGIAIN